MSTAKPAQQPLILDQQNPLHEPGAAVQVARPAEPMPLATVADNSPQSLIRAAIDRGLDVGSIERLVALADRMREQQAEAAITAALSAFQAACPPIARGKAATDTRGGGNKILYYFAPIEDIARHVAPFLAANGLSYSWDQIVTESTVTVRCIVRHVGGGTREATFSCPIGAGTSIMSAPQKVASTVSFAQRYALRAALGVTTCDEDDDARGLAGANDSADAQPATDDDIHAIDALLAETRSDRAKFQAWLGMAPGAPLNTETVSAAAARKALAALRRKLAEQQAGAAS